MRSVFVMVIMILTACRTPGSGNDLSEKSLTTRPTARVMVIQDERGDGSYWLDFEAAVAQMLSSDKGIRARNIEFQYRNAGGNPIGGCHMQMMQLLEVAVSQRPQMLIVSPYHPQCFARRFEELKRAGIPVITVRTDLEDTSLRAFHISSGTRQQTGEMFGRVVQQIMTQKLGAEQPVQYVVVQGYTNNDQTPAFLTGLEQAVGKRLTKNFTISSQDAAGIYSTVEARLTGRLDGNANQIYMTLDADFAVQVVRAAEAHGLTRNVFAVGMNATLLEMSQKASSPIEAMTFKSGSGRFAGQMAVRIVEGYLRGDSAEKILGPGAENGVAITPAVIVVRKKYLEALQKSQLGSVTLFDFGTFLKYKARYGVGR